MDRHDDEERIEPGVMSDQMAELLAHEPLVL